VRGQLQLPEDEQSDLLPAAVLAALQGNTDIRRQLLNPHLCELLDAIDVSSTPSDDVQRAMQLPIFVEFVDACMRHCYPDTHQAT
jgi:hypothetical protein